MDNQIRVGDRIRIETLEANGWGRVTFIDVARLLSHHTFPIQLELDEPYDDSGQVVYRVSLEDIKEKES